MAAPIAEAFVRLRPDLSRFRVELEAGLAQAVAGIRTPAIPVTTVGVAAGAPDTRALEQAAAAGVAAAARTAAATSTATTSVVTNQRKQNQAIEAGIVARTRLNQVEQASIGTTSAVGAAQREVTAARTALTKATLALALAEETENAELIAANAAIAANARLRLEQAVATTQSAHSEQQHAAQLRQTARGAAASSLSFLGLRGATLAASGAFLAGAASITAIGKSLASFANFERTLNVFQETAGATAEQMDRVAAAARQLGADASLPAVSAGDAADAMTQLARAGLSVEESINAARGVLQLATAANIDNAAATELVANALNSFSLNGTEAVHVADLLANAANAAQGEITDFGEAFAQVNAVASQVGVSLEDTTALLTLAARAGLRGSDAGTSFRTALLRLAAPTQEANDVLRSLGLNLRNLQGEIRPEVFAEFSAATADLAPDLRDAAAAAVFGQDAIRAALLTGRQGVQGLQDVRDQLARQGSAADLAAAQTKGLAGEVEGLSSELDTLGTRFGAVAGRPAGTFLRIIRNTVGAVNDFSEALANIDFGAFGDAVDETTSGQASERLGQLRDGFVTVGNEANTAALKVANFFRQFPGIRQAREDLVGLDSPLEDIQKHAAQASAGIEGIRTTLGNLGREAVDPRQLGLDDEAILSQVTKLRRQLQAALSDLSGVDPTSDLGKKAQQNIDDLIKRLSALGAGGRQAILDSAAGLVPALGQTLRAAVSEFTGIGDLVKNKVPDDIQETISRLAALGPEGRRVLKALGADLAASLAEGVEDNSDKAVTAARKALRDAIEAAQDQLVDSVRSARTNLESLGGTLGDQVAQIFEAAPISGAERALADLRSELERLQEATQRRQLRFNLGQARTDLADAQESLQQLGAATPEQAAARRKFLSPFQESVKDAQASLKEFTLEDQIEDQERLRDAAAKTAEEGIAKLVDQFERGEISASQFAARLNNQLKPAIDALPKSNLGFSFTQEFQRTLRTVVRQAKDLAGFLNTAGTEPGPQSVNVAAAAAAGRQRVTDAQANLTAQLTASRNTSKNTRETVAVLKEIRTILKPPTKNGTTGTKVIRLGGGEVVTIPTNK